MSLKLTWLIHSYSTCIEVLGEGIESSRFELESLGPISWCLVFFPRGYEDPNYVACFLRHCGDYRNREAVVDLEICIKAERGTEKFLKTTSNLRFKNGYVLGFPKFVTCKEFWSCFFRGKILTLQCCISPSKDTKYVDDFIPLSNDIKLLHDEKTFYDVIIRAGKNEFKVHKHLLIARCPSLVDQIECSHFEESIPFVVISDFSSNVVKEVLYFVYTGKLTTKCSEGYYYKAKLKEFASKYDMKNLLSKLNWNIGECTMNTDLKIISASHVLSLFKSRHLRSSTIKDFPVLRNVEYETKINVEYIISVVLQDIKINIELSIETSSEYKYYLLAKYEGYLANDKNSVVLCHEHSIHKNIFDVGSTGKSGIVRAKISFSFLLLKETLLKYRVNDNYRLYLCEWKISFRSSTTKAFPRWSSDTLTCFSDDMYDLFQHGIGTDLVLVTVSDGIEFNVHKSVVCARVPSIMAMFKGDVLAVDGYVHDDLKNVKVEIPDVDSNTFRSILKYIYSGKIDKVEMNRVLEFFPKLVPIYMKQFRKENWEN